MKKTINICLIKASSTALIDNLSFEMTLDTWKSELKLHCIEHKVSAVSFLTNGRTANKFLENFAVKFWMIIG